MKWNQITYETAETALAAFQQVDFLCHANDIGGL